MKEKEHQTIRWLVGAAAAFLLLAGLVSPTVALEPLPRPTVDPSSGGSGGSGGGSGDSGSTKSSVVHGTVLNWGFGGQPRAGLRLGDGGWQISTTSDDNGYYTFGNLGAGIGTLSLPLTSEDKIKVALRDVPVRFTGTNEVIVNLPVYTGENLPQPPVHLNMAVSPTGALPGAKVKYTIVAENGLPNGITHVILSDMLPQEFDPIEAKTTRGSVDILGKLVTVNIGEMAQGAKETVEIVAEIDPTVKTGTKLENYATLLYAESIAVQAASEMTVSGSPAVKQTVSTPTPQSEKQAVGAPTPLTDTLALPGVEATKENPAAPLALPTTGGEVLPFTGLALALLVLLAHRLRA